MLPLPLAGVRIIDLTAVWAGPYATRLLADMGAEVIKVEGRANPDLLRSLAFLPDEDPRAFNKSAFFNANNRNKLGCAIDLASSEGRAILLQLLKTADVVISNFRYGVMEKLQLSYDDVAAVRPDIVYVSMPGHGNSGPDAAMPAYATTVEQLAGLVSLTGYHGGEPHKSGVAYADSMAGTSGAAATVLALLWRQRTGRGQHAEISQRENLTSLIGEYIVGYSMNRRIPERQGNRHPFFAPHGCYPAGGEDEWVTIACETDAQFAQCCREIGRAELSSDIRFADAASRHRRQEELDVIIAAWTAARPAAEVAARLQACGVPAAPVLGYRKLLKNEHLVQRGLWEYPPHPEAGTWPMEGPAYRFRDSPTHIRTNGPTFGQHNRKVLGRILGYSEMAIADLYTRGVIADEPDMSGHQ